jgi:hypothetical protein
MSYVSHIYNKTSGNSGPESGKAIALAAQADEQRNANLLDLLRLPSELGGPNNAERVNVRSALFASLGVEESLNAEED